MTNAPTYLAIVYSFLIGAALIMGVSNFYHLSYKDHVRDYNACLALEAPAQKCLDTYLLPPQKANTHE